MNDTQRSRRPAIRSPRGSRESTQLGELEFSDWYEIPVFEPDEDELTEETATSGRGPRRAMARAKIARDARRAKRRPEWDAPVRRSAAPAPDAPAAEQVAQPATEPIAAREPVAARAAEPTPQVEPEPAPAEKPEPARLPARAKKPVPAPAPAPKPAPAPAPVAAMAQVSDEDTWMTSGPALTEESMQLDLDRESVWRRRLNTFLDRWAANEMAVAHRLDHSLERVMSQNLPKSIPDLLAAATKRGGSR